MNSPERFLAALNGEKPDRTPLAHVSALTTRELQDITGCFMPHVHHDPKCSYLAVEIASEPITHGEDWYQVPNGTVFRVGEDYRLDMEPLHNGK